MHEKTPLEAELEAYFRSQCKTLGLLTIKLNIQQNRGYPDRLVLHNGKAYFAELKTIHGKQSTLQKFKSSLLEAAGFSVPILRTKLEIKEYLIRIKVNLT